MLYRELNTAGGYLSTACGGGKITSTQFFLIDKGIFQWCAKGIVIFVYNTPDKQKNKAEPELCLVSTGVSAPAL